MATVADIFNSFGLFQWWNKNNVTQSFGQNGEQGDDYGMGGFGVPVGSITSGRVVYVGNGGYPGSSIGQIVQVLSSDGVYHYQHLQSSSVIKGQMVNVGDKIGTSGGCPVGAYGSNPGCTRYDQYSSGQHIEVRWSPTYNPNTDVWSAGNWQDPLTHFIGLGGGSGIPGSGNFSLSPSSDTSNVTPGFQFFDNLGQKLGLLVVGLVLAFIGFLLIAKGRAHEIAHGLQSKILSGSNTAKEATA